jgi:ABC-type iron transport system FetAB permease component
MYEAYWGRQCHGCGVYIGLDKSMSSSCDGRAITEARLSLGHDHTKAYKPLVQEYVRTVLIHIINAILVDGLISLTGMMTHQTLAGVYLIKTGRVNFNHMLNCRFNRLC